jgi:YD repeat-containing protein
LRGALNCGQLTHRYIYGEGVVQVLKHLLVVIGLLFLLGTASAVAEPLHNPRGAVQDKVLKLISQEEDGTGVGFLGGFGNILGFHRYTAVHYTIYYSSDDGTQPNRLAYSQIFDEGNLWTFYYDAAGQVTGMVDSGLNRLNITHNPDSTLTYEMIGFDGYVQQRATDTIPDPSAFSTNLTLRSYSGAPTDIHGPSIKIPVRVTACKSFPPRPLDVSLTYNYGFGTQTHLLELEKQNGVVFNYSHTIAPLEGLRTEDEAIELITEAFDCLKESKILDTICRVLPPGTLKGYCIKADEVHKAECVLMTSLKVFGINKAQKIQAILDGHPTFRVRLDAYYQPPLGPVSNVSRTKTYEWHQTLTELISVELPCWNIYQGDFRKSGTFTIMQPWITCQGSVKLGDRVKIIQPLPGAPGTPLLDFDYRKVLSANVATCFTGTFENAFTTTLDLAVSNGSASAHGESPAPFKEDYDFDLSLGDTAATGTYVFTMEHQSDAGGKLTANISVPLKLPLVRSKSP